MKKKIFLITLMVMLFVLALAFSVSAENKIIKHATAPTLEEIHANPSNFVSTLDAFASSERLANDSSSVVVICDQQATPTYFVFPAAYVIGGGTYSFDYGALNTALATADSTLFASYSENGGRGGSTYIIRVEMPTYVTTFGWDKFEGCPNLLEVYFPTHIVTNEETGESKEVTYITGFGGQADFFGAGTSKLQRVHNFEYIPVTSLTGSMFAGCSSLVELVLPAGLTSIPANTFKSCSSLQSIEIPKGVTSIGSYAFGYCSSLTEIILPNGVTSLGKGAFNGCSKLETIVLGASLESVSGSSGDWETFTGCNSLKYFYMPATFGSNIPDAPSANSYKWIFNSTSNVTFFFTGTEAQAITLQNKMIATKCNPNFANAQLEEYVPGRNYTDYGATKGSNVIVWGYNLCDAFYESNHIFPEATTLSIDSYVKGFDELCICNTCKDEQRLNDKEYAPIFTLLGYSAKIGGDRICVGYSLNYESLQKYEAVTGKTLSFGVVATIPSAGEDVTALEPVKAEIAPNDEYTIFANITGTYASFDFLITGFSEEYYDTALVMCAFVGDSEKVDYICGNSEATTQSEYASLITFGSLATNE